jgi:SAM-dependent methyltransferase
MAGTPRAQPSSTNSDPLPSSVPGVPGHDLIEQGRPPCAGRAVDVDVTEADRRISATARAVGQLDRVLAALAQRSAARPPRSLLDLGCGMGGLTCHVAHRLGIPEMIGVDADQERLEATARRGIRTFQVDLNHDRVPIDDRTVGLVTSFGVLPYLDTYDNTIREATRVLEDEGWLLVSMSNLASYDNRLALLLGFQPHEVQVSRDRPAGTLRRSKREPPPGRPPQLHAATLRCMSELLRTAGFDIVLTRGLSPAPVPAALRTLDALATVSPSWSRRFVILARKRPVAEVIVSAPDSWTEPRDVGASRFNSS